MSSAATGLCVLCLPPTHPPTRDLRGTLPYMAPELVSDPERVCEKADVWSLGVVMWEMLTRQTPFQVSVCVSDVFCVQCAAGWGTLCA